MTMLSRFATLGGGGGGGGGDPYWDNVSLLIVGNGANGTTTNIKDSSKNNLPITVHSGTIISTGQSKYGSGSILANSGYLSTPSTAVLQLNSTSFTIEGWVYPTGGSSYRSFLSKRTGGTAEYEVGMGPSGYLYVYIGMVVYQTATAITLNTWTYITVTYDGTNLRLFQNGNLLLTQSMSGAGSGTGFLVFFREAGTLQQQYVGYLYDVRITKSVARYTSTFTPPTEPFPIG